MFSLNKVAQDQSVKGGLNGRRGTHYFPSRQATSTTEAGVWFPKQRHLSGSRDALNAQRLCRDLMWKKR